MDKQQANRNRIHDFICRKTFRTAEGGTINRGQLFKARVTAFHSGGTEFFRFHFEGNERSTDVPCMYAQFHVQEEPKPEA
jgi:hypothetical protein